MKQGVGGGGKGSQNVLASKIVTIYFTENSLKLIQLKTSKKMGEGAVQSPWRTPKSTHSMINQQFMFIKKTMTGAGWICECQGTGGGGVSRG